MEVERERERERGKKERERENLFSPKGKKSLRGWNIFPRPEGRKGERKGRSKEIFFFLFFPFPSTGKPREFSQPGDVSARKQPDRARFDRHRVSTFVWVENAVCFQDFSNGTLVFCLAENVRPVKIFLDVPLFSVTENVIRCRVYWTSHKRWKVVEIDEWQIKR